jgi:hypothetical protein
MIASLIKESVSMKTLFKNVIYLTIPYPNAGGFRGRIYFNVSYKRHEDRAVLHAYAPCVSDSKTKRVMKRVRVCFCTIVL